MPTARRLGSGSSERGYLIAGVAADNYLLGFRNPFSGQIEGFDIDMVNLPSPAAHLRATPPQGHMRPAAASSRPPTASRSWWP